MRVYYNSSGLAGCYLVRCLLPLTANGWDGDYTSLYPEAIVPQNRKDAANAADIVVFHRPETPTKLELMRILKELGKKIVVDNDDTFKDLKGLKFYDYLQEQRGLRKLKSVNLHFDQAVKEADLVTCSTDWLNTEYKELNKNVITLPNCIDPFYFDEPLRNETDVVRIGVVGSIMINADTEVLFPILKHYHGDKRVKFVVFSLPREKEDAIARSLYADQYKFLDTLDVEWQPFIEPQYYYDTLNSLRLDMMIIPRQDSYLNRAKSNLKFLEGSMFEIPIIAQGFKDNKSPYEVNPEDAKHMEIVTNNDDWIPRIEDMIKDKAKRVEMGRKAKEYVTENYDINKKAHLWEDAYKTIYQERTNQFEGL